MSESSAEPQRVLRWYTRARRVPRFIGRAPGGGHYPGGPYTLTQAAGAAGVLILGQSTMSVWGQFGFIGNNVIVIVAVIATLVALKFVKQGGRDPVTAAWSVVSLTASPSWGRQAGRPVRLPRGSTRVTQRVNAQIPDRVQAQAAPLGQPARAAEAVAPVQAGPETSSVSVLQQMLRGTTTQQGDPR